MTDQPKKPIDMAAMDQAVTSMVRVFPPLWAGLYRELVSKEQLPTNVALAMVCAYIRGSATTNPNPDPPPSSDLD